MCAGSSLSLVHFIFCPSCLGQIFLYFPPLPGRHQRNREPQASTPGGTVAGLGRDSSQVPAAEGGRKSCCGILVNAPTALEKQQLSWRKRGNHPRQSPWTGRCVCCRDEPRCLRSVGLRKGESGQGGVSVKRSQERQSGQVCRIDSQQSKISPASNKRSFRDVRSSHNLLLE